MFIRYGSIVILVFLGIVGIIGCGHKIRPKGWLSVEKPPIRVILVDSESDIDEATVCMVLDKVSRLDYRDVKFNESTTVGVNTEYIVNRTDNITTSLKVDR